MSEIPKTYHITTLEGILDVVNPDNIECFLGDFADWLVMSVHLFDQYRKDNPEYCKGKTNSEICKIALDWTDDGVQKLTHTKFTNVDTGEVIIVNHE